MRAFVLVPIVAAFALYAGTLDHYFLSDDFLNLERNGFQTLGEGLALFSTNNIDFYRPIPRLHFGILSGLVADNVFVWNVVGLLLHAIASGLAYLLARDLLGPKRAVAAGWAGVLFAVHFIHVEPVVWASGVTGTWATLFLFGALLLQRRARRTGRTADAVGAVLCLAGALLSKETAVVFVPLWFVTAWAWPGTDDRGESLPRHPTVSEAIPFAVLLGAYLLIAIGVDRGGDASPYRMAFGPHVFKNVGFFALGGFVPVRYWEVQQLWAGAPGLGGFLADVIRRPHLGLPLVAGAAALAWTLRRGGRDVRGGLLWMLAAALPFLPLPGSGERFQYLSSFGACLVLGIGIEHAGKRFARRDRAFRMGPVVGVLVTLAFVAGNLDRQADWRLASDWTRTLVARWDYFKEREATERIEFEGVSGAWRSAWVFRNGFPSMVRLFWQGRPYWRAEERPPVAPDVVLEVRLGERGNVVIQPRDGVENERGVPPGTP